MISFTIKAHTTEITIHGRPYRFELPVFSEKTPGGGLYISVENYYDRDEEAYLVVSSHTMAILMKGWRDYMGEKADIVDFARQNVAEFRHLALNTTKQHLRWEGEPRSERIGGRKYSIYHPAELGEV